MCLVPESVAWVGPRMWAGWRGIQALLCPMGEMALSSGSCYLDGGGVSHGCVRGPTRRIRALAWASPQSDGEDTAPILGEPPVRQRRHLPCAPPAPSDKTQILLWGSRGLEGKTAAEKRLRAGFSWVGLPCPGTGATPQGRRAPSVSHVQSQGRCTVSPTAELRSRPTKLKPKNSG